MEKLTHMLRGGYDKGGVKYMSESATTELLPGIRQEVLDTWQEDLDRAQSSAEREGIWAAIRSGVSKRQQEVKDMADEEVNRIAKEIETKESKERKRTKMEENIDNFIQYMKGKSEYTEKGASHPKYEINGEKREKHNLNEMSKKEWADIGWGEAEKASVDAKLKDIFKGKDALDEAQRKSAIDLFVATGKKASKIIEEMDSRSPNFEPSSEEITAAGGSREYARARRKREWLTEFNMSENYIERFILQDDFAEDLERHYQGTDPGYIEEVAWQVMHYYKHPTWGPHGKFPLLEMRIAKRADGTVDPDNSKYYLNQANFAVWARERMWSVYDLNNDVGDFMPAINLPKQYSPLDFGRMLQEFKKYFASEDGETSYNYLAQEMIVESAGLGTMNNIAVKYKQEMKDPDGLQKAIGEMFASNIFTKETFRKNLIELLTIMPLRYEGNREGELLESDGIFGSAILEMFLIYYNLSDFDALQEMLGKGSSFFTRDSFLQAFQSVAEDKVGESSGETHPTVMNAEMQGYFDKAFDANGQISTTENRDNFISLINFFGHKLNNTDGEYTVRRMLYQQVAEKYGRVVKNEDGTDKIIRIYHEDKKRGRQYKEVKKYGLTADEEGTKEDTWTLRMAWVAASAMSRIFGAGARNDTTAQGYDGMTKMHLAEVYRDKMLNKNGDEAGNPYTIHQFKIFAMDPFNAIVTESFENVKDENGKIKMKKDGHGHWVPVTRKKVAMEVLREMNHTSAAYAAQLKKLEGEYAAIKEDGPAKKAKLAELIAFKKKKSEKYLNKAGELTFQNRAMSNYYDDHLMRAHEIWKVVMSAGEVTMDKYVRYDAYGGVHFNRAEFQKDVQHTIIHPIRYFLNTYPDVKYNQKFRMLDQAATIRQHKPVYREMTLGEAMFGHDLLNREAFWKKDDKGKPINKVINGHKLKGVYEIDYDKVEANKILVWKQWFMTKLAADLWSHRDFHSTDTRYDLNYYKNIVEAIASIPGGFTDDDQAHGQAGLQGDEFSIRDQAIIRRFFDKKDMAWFKKTARVENFDLYFRAVFKDILLEDEKEEGIGLMLALSLFTRQIVKQGG